MEYDITLNDQDVQIILQALGELPLKVTLNTFLKVHNQISETTRDS